MTWILGVSVFSSVRKLLFFCHRFPSPSGSPYTDPSLIHRHPDPWFSARPPFQVSGGHLRRQDTSAPPHHYFTYTTLLLLVATWSCLINVLTYLFCLLQENVNLMRVEPWGVLYPPTPTPPTPQPPSFCHHSHPERAWHPVGYSEQNEAFTSSPGWRGVPAACWCCPLVALDPHCTWLFNLPSHLSPVPRAHLCGTLGMEVRGSCPQSSSLDSDE